MGDVLEKFIFSKEYNFKDGDLGESKEQPEMLTRLMAGLLHPMIHTAYGLEFGIRGILAEGTLIYIFRT